MYDSLGWVLSIGGIDIAAIESALKRGLALEPGHFDLLAAYASLAVDLGRADGLTAAESCRDAESPGP